MNPLERFSAIFLIAGLAFFGLSIVVEAWLPYEMLSDIPMLTIDDIAKDVPADFADLAARYPDSFRKYYGEVDSASYAKALRLGRDVYSAEACWHCHSQFVRPVSNEDRRFGLVSYPGEYENELQLPQMFGTRRVGPDLIRESGRHSNDWQAAHFWEPTAVVPVSVMPSFKWFFEVAPGPDAVPQPNDRGIAIIAYVQWLGSWAERPDSPLLLPGAAGRMAPPGGAQ
jgi:cytochrome c oxidase cbb3-type subunit 2